MDKTFGGERPRVGDYHIVAAPDADPTVTTTIYAEYEDDVVPHDDVKPSSPPRECDEVGKPSTSGVAASSPLQVLKVCAKVSVYNVKRARKIFGFICETVVKLSVKSETGV